jgi:hypothetical protein
MKIPLHRIDIWGAGMISTATKEHINVFRMYSKQEWIRQYLMDFRLAMGRNVTKEIKVTHLTVFSATWCWFLAHANKSFQFYLVLLLLQLWTHKKNVLTTATKKLLLLLCPVWC